MSYIFGQGTPYTQDDMRRHRVAEELNRGRPRDSFSDSFNAVVGALGGWEDKDTQKQETPSVGPFIPPQKDAPPAFGNPGPFKASVPTGDMAGTIRAGMIERGIPEHVADAFIVNMQDESGLNPGINEAAPIVPGSRGGFGLYQLTGPRRRDYEAFASSRGVDPSDVNAQLDWLMHELQGPEARAADAIFSAQDTPSAAVAILNKFLRPAEEHRRAREARYWGIG
jgi:hypothetical protein